MIVPRRDHREMQQGMGSQETRAGNCRGPIPGPPDACGKRQTGDKECCAYVLDEVRGPVSDTPGTLSYQAAPANNIINPLSAVSTAKTAAMDLRMGTSCGQDERWGPCDESGQKNRTLRGPKMPEISPWQAGKESLNNRFRACWPLLARLCSHSENPIR
jgi:hypothetical protein